MMPAPPLGSRLGRALRVTLFNAFCVAGVVSLFWPSDEEAAEESAAAAPHWQPARERAAHSPVRTFVVGGAPEAMLADRR
jgi:hypothetical protein